MSNLAVMRPGAQHRQMLARPRQRLLVWTNSGQVQLEEAYAFEMDGDRAVPTKVRRA
jgi:hypothetical protein